MATTESVRALLEPPLAAEGFEVVDVQVGPTLMRVFVDRLAGHEVGDEAAGITMDDVTKATHLVIAVLDADDPIPGHYTLEVSSPGLERPLRTPDHFRRFTGELVHVKTIPTAVGERRMQGTLEAADADGITIDGRRIAYADIDRARTVVEWEKPKPKASRKAAKGTKTQTQEKKAVSS